MAATNKFEACGRKMADAVQELEEAAIRLGRARASARLGLGGISIQNEEETRYAEARKRFDAMLMEIMKEMSEPPSAEEIAEALSRILGKKI